MNTDHEHGPYGHYEKNTYGHVLNALCAIGIPISRVQFVEFAKGPVGQKDQGILKLNKEFFAAYQYFDWSDLPLFRFNDINISSEIVMGDPEKPQVEYRLLLSSTGSPMIKIWNPQIKFKLLQVLERIFNSYLDQKAASDEYRVRMDANAIWNKRLTLEDPCVIEVEFWKPDGAQAFVKYLTEQVNA